MTPGLGIVATLLVVFVMKEPVRGLNDGQRATTKAVRGKDGFRAYLEDMKYLIRKSALVWAIDDPLPYRVPLVISAAVLSSSPRWVSLQPPLLLER